MLEFLAELVFDGCELGDGEGGEVDWEAGVYQYDLFEVLRSDGGRIVCHTGLGLRLGWGVF